jgi:hypothetical protein
MGYVRDDVTPRRCLVPSGARVHCGGPRVGKLVLDQGSKLPVNQPSILMLCTPGSIRRKYKYEYQTASTNMDQGTDMALSR